MRRKNVMWFVAIALLFAMACNKKKPVKEKPAYLNTDLSFEERVNDLVSRMTLEEKVSQTLYNSPAIERLGIPEYNWWNECLHGVARAGRATVFPQAIGLAATWDTEHIGKVANAISDEARAKHHEFVRNGNRGIYQGLTFWTPNINIFRDPRWGRGMETYGEDPYLSGQIATEFIKGLQGNDPKYFKTIATAKHFVVHSGPEPDRHSFDAITNERDFYDTYLAAFRTTVIDAKVYSVMCAYNRYKGEACCGSSFLLNDILRNQWKFEGYVVSDCWAIVDFFQGHNISKNREEAASLAIKSGTDLNCGVAYLGLTDAVKQGLVTEAEIDVAVKRLFLARFKLGLFDGDANVKYASTPYSVVESEENGQLALETARKSIVLLKNENNTLPLSKDLKTIAVIGPNANDVEVMLGNYNGFSSKPITPLEGIRQKLPNTQVLYALGSRHADNLPVFEVVPESVFFTTDDKATAGLTVEYFDNREFKGDAVVSEMVKKIDTNWWDKAPLENLDDDNFGVRYTGVVVPEVSGKYAFGAEGFSGFKLYVNDSLFVEFQSDHHPVKTYKYIDFEAGKAYKIRLDFYDIQGDAFVKLLWEKPNADYKKEALEIAKKADAVVMFLGLSPRLEGEEMKVEVEGFKGGDRMTLDLPKAQMDLMKALKATGKPLVLVLLNGSALAVNWANDNISAIVEAWYPGQAAGTAIADVLFGDYNPAGRLPVTFYKSVTDLPPFADYNMKGRTYRYFSGEVLYPFGFGLSYSTFEYKNPKLEKDVIKNGETVKFSVEVTNTGTVAGEEVIQLYIKDVESSEVRPLKDLRGFQRQAFKAGETKTISFDISPKQLEFYDTETKKYIVENGEFIIMVGKSSADKDLVQVGLRVE